MKNLFRDLETILPPNKKFGRFFSAVFLLAAAWFWWIQSPLWTAIFGCLTGATAIVTSLKPDLLRPFNKAWMALGLILSKIISPIVLGLIFFVLITPVGLVVRLFGRDELLLRLTSDKSYWRVRDPAGPAPDSFKNQF